VKPSLDAGTVRQDREQRVAANGPPDNNHSMDAVDYRAGGEDARTMTRARQGGPTGDNRRQIFGRYGEDAAAEFLRRKGFTILGRNVRTAFGELDLIALDGDVIVFVEVKARRATSGLEAVDARKQLRLSRLALAFLARAGWLGRAARFDVIAVESGGACTHVVNAFDCASGS